MYDTSSIYLQRLNYTKDVLLSLTLTTTASSNYAILFQLQGFRQGTLGDIRNSERFSPSPWGRIFP